MRFFSFLFIFVCVFHAGAYAIGGADIIVEGGVGAYNTDSDPYKKSPVLSGANYGVSALFPVLGVGILSAVAGPRLTYQTLAEQGSYPEYGVSELTETFVSKFYGAQLGVRFRPINFLSAYLTGYADYDVDGGLTLHSNSVSNDYKTCLKDHWDKGINSKIILSPLPFLGVGVSYYYGQGSYHYEGGTWGASSASPIPVSAQTIAYTYNKINLVLSVLL